MNLSYILLGYIELKADIDNLVGLLNICMYNSIPYTDFKVYSDGSGSMKVRSTVIQKLSDECSKANVHIDKTDSGGLAIFIYNNRHRYGIFIGIICAIALVFASESFIWDIRVTGNKQLTSTYIIELLSDYGLKVGSFIRNVNTNKIENKITLDSDEISWISVNILGTVAEVEVVERRIPEEKQNSGSPANIVAKKGGVIEYIEPYRGNIIVKNGDIVDAGDLLISGVFDSSYVGFRYTRAQGNVFAKTVTEFDIEIPYEYLSKVYKEEEKYEKTLNFFGFSLNISKKYGNDTSMYDTIRIVKNIRLPDGTIMPVGTTTKRYLEYEYITAKRTENEAEHLAYFELTQRINTELGNALVLKKTITPRISDNSFSLHCTVICLENISQAVDFDVDIT